jgi:hypothetical protein
VVSGIYVAAAAAKATVRTASLQSTIGTCGSAVAVSKARRQTLRKVG